MPVSPEPIIAQVRRQLADDARVGPRLPPDLLDRVADRVVRDLWESRVKVFVPVLALRQARELLQELPADQGVEITAEREMAAMETAEPPAVERASRDVRSLLRSPASRAEASGRAEPTARPSPGMPPAPTRASARNHPSSGIDRHSGTPLAGADPRVGAGLASP
jgi:hypothetical protein